MFKKLISTLMHSSTSVNLLFFFIINSIIIFIVAILFIVTAWHIPILLFILGLTNEEVISKH